MPGNIQNYPPSVLFTWPPANYVDPVEMTWLVPYAAVMQALTSLFIALRLFLRFRNQAGPFGLDDLMLIPAFLASTMFSAICIISVEHYSIGRHIWDVEYDKFEGMALLAWLSECAFLIAATSAKTSVLLFLRRFAHGTHAKRWKIAIICAVVFAWTYTSVCILALLCTCRPVSAYWRAFNFSYALNDKYYCADTRPINIINGVMTVISDLYSVLLPMAMLWNLDCPRRQKIALNLMFSIGLIVVAVGSVRTYFLHQLGYTEDPSWLGFKIYFWSDTEIQLSIICAVTPALRVFFRQYVRNSVISTTIEPTGSNFDDDPDEKSRFSYIEVIKALPRRMQSTNSRPAWAEKSIAQQEPFDEEEEVFEKHPVTMTVTPMEPVIRTAEEYEAYAIRNLQSCRSAARGSVLRHSDLSSTNGPPSAPIAPDYWDALEKC